MLDYVEGNLVHIEQDFAVIDTGGWGLRLNISVSTYNKIKMSKVDNLKLFTHMVLRDDSIELFGFADEMERQAYVLLNKVPGIGPKAAISILSMMDVSRLKTSIISEDIKTLVTVPGVGKKTAQKIIIELKDRIKDLHIETDEGNYEPLFEAREVLLSLGFNPGEIQLVLSDTSINDNRSVEDIIKTALKKLSK